MSFEVIVIIAAAITGIIAGGVVHEYGHAWSALKLGDDTAARMGRLTFQPVPHIDPFMTIVLPLVLVIATGVPFGGMKPVPINPAGLRHPRRDIVWTALAGPGFQLGFVLVVFALYLLLTPLFAPGSYAFTFFYIVFFANVLIAFFNLIPIPPLDGSRVLAYFLPPQTRRTYLNLPPVVGIAIVLVLVLTGVIRAVLGPLVHMSREFFAWAYVNLGLHNWTGNLHVHVLGT